MLEVEAGNKTGIYYVTVSNVRPGPRTVWLSAEEDHVFVTRRGGTSLTGCSSPLTRSGRN